MTEDNNQVEKQEEQKEDPAYLKMVKKRFERQLLWSTRRKERIENLCKRKSSSRWSPQKSARMARRLAEATNTKEQSYEVVDNINHRLSVIENPNA